MVELRFEGLSAHQSVVAGPAPWFRIAGNYVRQGPSGAVVAQLERHQWSVGQQFFSRFDCRGPLVVHFEDAGGEPSGAFGPFTSLAVADGTMYSGDRVLAKFAEETQLWHAFPTETYWPVLVIAAPPVGSPPHS
jgi:hypothetical protein